MLKSKSFKIIASILVFGLLFSQVDLSQLFAAFKGLTPSSISFLMLISFILLYISALKWSYFLKAFGSPVSVIRLFNLYLLGYFVNLIAPSYIGGDAARSYYIGKDVGQHKAFAATILERYTGLVAMLSLGVVFVWFVDLVTWPMKLAIFGAALGLAVATVFALSPKLLDLLSRVPLLSKSVPHLRKIQESLHLAKGDRFLLAKSLALSYLYHTFTVVNVLSAAYVVGWMDPPVRELFVALPLVLLISALPLTPNSLGIQEGAYYYFLSGLGAPGSTALAIGLILRAKQYVLAVLGWFVFMAVGGQSRGKLGATASHPG